MDRGALLDRCVARFYAPAILLGAFLLFVMTFAINTAAELTRQHLREKYKTV